VLASAFPPEPSRFVIAKARSSACETDALLRICGLQGSKICTAMISAVGRIRRCELGISDFVF
jgi:hypothetical protein